LVCSGINVQLGQTLTICEAFQTANDASERKWVFFQKEYFTKQDARRIQPVQLGGRFQ